MTTSMEVTFVFCAMFLYYMNISPSLAALPLHILTQSSTKQSGMGLSAGRGVDLKHFKVNIFMRDWSAAWVCPTKTNPSLPLVL